MSFLAAASALTLLTCGHPFHATAAELEVKDSGALLEVALKLDALEIETVLSQRAGRRLTFEDEDAAQALSAYFRTKFLARSARGAFADLTWIGHEIDGADAWTYFELRFDGAAQRLWLTNQLLFERNAFQRNDVAVTLGARTQTLSFEAETGWLAVDLQPVTLRPHLWNAPMLRPSPADGPGWSLVRTPLPQTRNWWRSGGGVTLAAPRGDV